MSDRERLMQVQQAGQRAINALAAPMASDAEALVRRAERLTPIALLFLRRDLSLLLLGAEFLFSAVVVSAAREGERAADPTGDVDVAALSLVGWTTAQSLAKVRPSIVNQAMSLVQRGAALGLTVIQTAQTVRQYFYRRDPTTGLIQAWPGQANMATERVRGLMQFESTAGHFRGMQRAAFRDDGLMLYSLSGAHLKADSCDQLAQQDNGFGPGLYLPQDAPSVPRHFRCRCFYSSRNRPSSQIAS